MRITIASTRSSCMLALLAVHAIALAGAPATVTAGEPPSRLQVEQMMGLRSAGDMVRGQLDGVGFVVTAEQAADVVGNAVRLEATALAEQDARLGMAPGDGFSGGICPHDDHLYSAPVTVHLTERITAPRVILIGVFHKARLWDLEGRIVLDDFQAWHGPWGPVRVDPLREEIAQRLPRDSYIVDNTMHCREHSLESILPFLQSVNREVSIVPILVPYLRWEQIDTLAGHLAQALSSILDAHGWRLGRDVAVVVSNDAVHYGPDFDHAPFGTGASGYTAAVERDRHLIAEHLEGQLGLSRLHDLLYTLVERDDVRSYRIPWCGRFAVPFGLEVLRRLSEMTGSSIPEGHLLRYGTSLSEPELPVSAATRSAGLGYTAPSNLHHWVGFMAVGYR